MVGGGGQLSDLQRFVNMHNRFIVKPVAGSCGRGVKIYDISDYTCSDELVKELVDGYCRGWNGGFIAEEVIEQDEQMASLHPSSVNTVRFPTIKFSNRVEVLHPFMRLGRGNMIVDNGGAGGILCAIDVETGKVLAAMDEKGMAYEKHPDTGCQIIGFTIPRWDEAVAIVKEMAMVVKDNRYTGWDMALSNKGWVMVEGNAMGQFIWQIPTQQGFMKEANEILKELNLKQLRY